MKTLFFYWKVYRYLICGLVAFWGFFLIFKNGINSGGKTLLFISSIGVISTFIADLVNRFILKKESKVN